VIQLDPTAGYGQRIVTQEIAKSYFSQPGPKAKKQRKDDRKAVATGVGAVAAGGGLVAGGIPGMQAHSGKFANKESGTKVKAKPGEYAAAGRGGIFGFRINAHENYLKRKTAELKDPGNQGMTSQYGHFMRGRTPGKIESEKKILAHMKTGRKASHVALAGGTAALIYGSQRKPKLVPREEVGKTFKVTSDNPRRDNTALAVGGAVGGAGAYGAARGLESQGRQWNKRAVRSLKEADKLVPGVGEHKIKASGHRVPRIEPTHSTEGISWGQDRFFHEKDHKVVERAGKLHGKATQEKYFGHVYGKTARGIRRGVLPVAAGASALGGYNLYRGKRPDKKVRKSLAELSYEVEKGRFRDARAARQLVRQTKRADKRGRLVRSYVEPAKTEFQQTARESIKEAEQAVDRSSRKASRRVGVATGVGLGGGLAGGLTLGELGRQTIRHRYEEASKSEPISDFPAGYYQYLLPTIREEIAAIPETRRNPISPLQQIAGSRLMADGTRKIRSPNPFFRTRRTREGMKQVVMGQQMVNRGAGEPL